MSEAAQRAVCGHCDVSRATSKLAGLAAIFAVLACSPRQPDAAQRLPDSLGAAAGEQRLGSAPDSVSPCSARAMTGAGIGALRIGATVDSVRAICPITHDSVEIRAEGLPARIIRVALGTDTIEAEVVDDRVWRITVDEPGLATADSLGVGTRLSRLLEKPGAHGAVGEGRVFVLLPDSCGLSFRLATRPGDVARFSYDDAGLRTLPPSSVVDQVLITGCSAQG